MVDEVVAAVASGPHTTILDGTLGLGGHAAAILERVPGVGLYIGIDRDPRALAIAGRRLGPRPALSLHHATFDRAHEVLDSLRVPAVDVALLDLGVSSLQLDDPGRGFSFQSEGPLDMRMDPAATTTALALVSRLPIDELARLLREHGEVDCPGRVARAIHENRSSMKTTLDLARIVERALPGALKSRMKIHPATKVFLALRSAVNDEPAILERALPRLVERLSPRGRLVVIAFHSLEDRVVKRFLAGEARGCICPPALPVCGCGRVPTMRVQGKAVVPRQLEAESNPRSRSAKLRIGVRL